MNPTQTRPSVPRRRIAWFVWLGVALLAVSVLGASKSLQSPSDTPAYSGKTTDVLPGGFGHVDLEGGVTSMYPLQPGRVVEVLAHDGDVVEKGAPLFRLDDTLANIELQRAQSAVAEAEAQLRLAQLKVKEFDAALEGQKLVVEAKRNNVKAVEAQAKEAKRLNEAQQLSKFKLDQAQAAVDAASAEVKAEERKELSMRTEGAEEVQISVKRAENNLDDKKGQKKMAQYALDERTVKAPAKGQVLRMLVAVGDPLSAAPRQPAVQFAIDGLRIVRTEIDQEFAARVQVGQAAEIRDDVRTGPSWTGKVRRISNWYTHRRSILQDPLQFNDVRTLEVIVELDNPPPDLKIGQRVVVTLK